MKAMRTWTKKLTASIIMIAIVFSPLFLLPTKQAEAGVNFKSLTGPVLGAAISCNINKITSAISGLSGKLDLMSVSTNDSKTNTKLNCLNAIATAAAQVLLKNITAETLNWINGGFKESPLFIKNPNAFVKNMRDQEVGSFISDISLNSPFGQSFAKAYVTSLRNKFADNSTYSFNRYFAESDGAKKFETDFTVGGWDAWMGLAQLPQNNPLGYQLQATQEISRRTVGLDILPSQQLKDELNWGQGYLSPKVCVDPAGGVDDNKRISAQRELDSLIRGNNARGDIDLMGPQPEGADPLTQEESITIGNAMAELKQTIADNTCNRTEISTPGTAIASLTNTVLGSPLRQLEGPLAMDLNNSLSAVFDALLNQLFTQGIDALGGGDSSDNVETFDSENSNFDPNTYVSLYENKSLTGSNNSGGWGVKGSGFFDDFDITKDLSDTLDANGVVVKDGLITMQIKYEENIKKQKKLITQLIPAIYQLDLCIPGPHPGWDTDGDRTIDDFTEKYPETYDDFLNFSASLGTSVANTVDWLVNFSQSLSDPFGIGQMLGLTNSESQNYATASRRVIATTTGLNADDNHKIDSKYKVTKVYNTLWAKYKPYLAKYDMKNIGDQEMVDIMSWASNEYKSVDGYRDIMLSIDEAVSTSKVTQARLNILKNKIEDLNKMTDKTISSTRDCKLQKEKDTYQCRLEAYQRTFSGIAPNIIGEEQYQLSIDGIDSYQETIAQIIDPGQFLDQCINLTDPLKNPNYNGPLERRQYPNSLLPNPYPGVIYEKDNSYTPGLLYTNNTDTNSCPLPSWGINMGMYPLIDATFSHVNDSNTCLTGPWDGLEDFLGIY